MRILSVHIVCMLLFVSCQAAARPAKSSYVLAESQQETEQKTDAAAAQEKETPGFMLVGAESGLYKLSAVKTAIPVLRYAMCFLFLKQQYYEWKENET